MRKLSAALILCVSAFGCDNSESAESNALPLATKAHFMGVCGNDLLEEAEECDDSNVVNGDGCSDTCELEDPRLVITEVMSDPSPIQDGLGEWFEIHNPTANPIDLEGWTLQDSQDRSDKVDESVVIPAGGYILVGRYDLPGLNGGLELDYAYGNTLVLANQAAGLRLRDPVDGLIDEINWDGGDVWPNPRGNGQALQLGSESDPGGVDNDEGDRWCYADTVMANGMFGTPGAANSACSVPVCGDGELTGNEECDDGGTANGDGCDDSCQLAPELRIIEVMTDPESVADAAGEWFEIFNPTIYDTDIQGWTFTDEGTNTFVVNSSVVVPAMGYAVLGKSTDQGLNGGIAVDYAFGSAMALANQTDRIVMLDDGDNEIDRVSWDGGAEWPDPDSDGSALQYGAGNDALTGDNNDGGNWCYATDALANGDNGTPGAANPPCEIPVCGDGVVGFQEECDDGGTVDGDGCDASCQLDPIVVLTEVMSDPEVVSDGAGEWFELFNATAFDNDIEGWTFTGGAGESFTVVGSLILPANGYLVFGKSTDTGVNGNVDVDYAFGNNMALGNTADEIIVRDAEGTELDRIEWDTGVEWPNPAGGGRTHQFDDALDPLTDDNNDGSNWCRPVSVMANTELGTPGAANDECVVCGNGRVDDGEECDDGNLVDGDGCESDCTVGPTCGDNNVDDGEECDDGNSANDDGCSDACAYERRLVITEVMQDPESVADSVGEWFEVHNPSLIALDLDGYDFTDEAGESFTVAGELIVPIGGYVVFGRSADTAVNGNINVDYAYGAVMSHANLADKIVMLDAADAEVDRVEWDNGATWPNPQGRGRSMQFDGDLDALADDNNDGGNWCRPVTGIGNGDFGTPRGSNDSCAAVPQGCGNGVVEAGEECDDENLVNGDGCSAMCMTEAVCGDGNQEGNEECDDGNQVNNDGCDSLCSDENIDQLLAEQTRTSTIAAGSSDWFAFTVDEDGFYNIESYGAGGGCSGNTQFNLYAAGDLENAIASDDDSGVGLCSLIQGPITPGDYVLQVTGSGGVQVPVYTLDFLLLVATNPPGGTYDGAVAAGGSDLYAFANPAQQDLVVVVDDGAGGCPAGADSVVQLFELSGVNRNLIAENDDGGTAPPCSELVVSDLAAGNYYLFVAGKNGGAVAAHSVTITYGNAPTCGDGAQEAGEACDDGNLVNGDGCSDQCEVEAACGDGNLDDGEECDDSNLVNGDGCDDTCALESTCGDGVVEGAEQCDDNNVVNGDGCSDLCRVEASIVITEVMTDPAATGDFQGEWFEVHNPTQNAIDLQGWRFTDGGSDDFTVNISVPVAAGGYALLARLYDPASNGGLDNVDFAYGLDMLHSNQRTDRIIAFAPGGAEADRVEWTTAAWPNPGGNGRSLSFDGSLDPAVDDNNDGANWCFGSSAIGNGDQGTPGGANDACQ